MQSYRSLDDNNNPQKILKMTQKDFEKVSEWYKASKTNYFKGIQDESLKRDQFREVHLRLYFSQIYFSDTFINSNIQHLRNLRQNSLSIVGGILKSQDQELKGKPYESKNIEGYYDMNTKSLVLKDQINLYTYTLQNKNRDSVFFLDFTLINNDSEVFRIGKLQFNMNSNLNQISELSINNKNKEKIAFIQAIIEKQPIKDFPKILPPNVIIDKNSTIPSIKLIQMKNRREPIVLDTRSKMKLLEIKITLKEKSRFTQKVQRNNPFLSSHHQNVQITQIDYKLKFGCHNSWKFIDMKEEVNVISLKQIQVDQKTQKAKQPQQQIQLISDFNKGFLNKTYFECTNCVFAALLYAQITYKYEGFVDKKVQNLGWCLIMNKLYEQSIKFESFLETHNSLPGYEIIVAHNGIKLSALIQNPDHKHYRKKIQDSFSQQIYFNQIFVDQQADLLTKTIFVKRQVTQKSALLTSMGTLNQLTETQKQLQQLVQQVEKEMQRTKRKITIKGHFVSSQPKVNQEKQKDWQSLLNLENKCIKVVIKLISMIPQTDQITYRKGLYYLPLRFKTKIFVMRKTVQLQNQFVDNNASWNIPVFIKSNKQSVSIETVIKGKEQLKKIMDSEMLLMLWDLQDDKFYGKGSLSVMDMLSPKDSTRYEIQLMNESKKMGSIVIQVSTSTRSGDRAHNKRQVSAIQTTSIIQSLPMKQRLMMRISNFNQADSELQNKAISYYKQKNMPTFINQITNSQYSNAALIQYELGQTTYHLLQFKNTSQSQNNIFTFLIKDCDFAQIITDEQQYKQIIMNYKLDPIPYNKIQFQSTQNSTNRNNSNQSNNNEAYLSKIAHNQTIGILIKIQLLEWSNKIKPQSIFQIQIQRNTMPVSTHKFKLSFKQPIIHQIITLYQINHNLSKGITFNLPQQILNTYQQFSSFSKQLVIKNKPKLQFRLVTHQNLKSPHKLQFLIQGKFPISQFEDKLENILVEMHLLEGQFVEVQLGQIVNKKVFIDTKANHLLNQILILPDKNITPYITSKNSVFIINNQTKIDLNIISFTMGKQNILIKLYNLKYQLQYQYLIKLITNIKINPQLINPENFIGQKLILQCTNPYVTPMQFYVFTNTQSVIFHKQILTIQPKTVQKLIIQLVDKLYQKSYIAIYDQDLLLTQLFILHFNSNNQGFKMHKIIKQNCMN